jgi:GNAT superfamily N-acetyltransferase
MQASEAGAVADLWRAYMTEQYGVAGDMTAEVFLRGGLGARFNTVLARDPGGAPVAVAAWWPTYDLHHAVSGGEIPDMFVARPHRGSGVAVQLIAAVAREVRAGGGIFLRGPATPENAQRLTRTGRLNGAFPLVNVYWAAELFNALADDADAGIRTLARSLAAAKPA